MIGCRCFRCSSRWFVVCLACAVLAVALVAAGCQAPKDGGKDAGLEAWAAARRSVTAAETVLLDLHAGGVLTDEKLVALDPAMKTARAALAAALPLVEAGDPSADGWLLVAEDSIRTIQAGVTP